jgi:hypothetical protein
MKRKFFAIVTALITGGLGLAALSVLPQAVEAGIKFN